MRPKFFVDENLPHDYANAFRKPFKSAIFSSHVEEKLSATEDVDIFRVLQERGFTAILTADRRQLHDPIERDALRTANLHWVGVGGIESRGVEFHADAIASLLEVIPQLILDAPSVPHSFHVTPESRHRIKLVASPI